MLPIHRADAFTPQSTSDYQSIAAREPALPPNLDDFLALLGPEGKVQPIERQAALSAAIRHLQAQVPEAASIQLWLLVSFAAALQILAARFQNTSRDSKDAASTVAWAFLETLHAMGEERLASPWLAREIVRDTRRRLLVLLGLRDYQQETRLEELPDEALMEDRLPDESPDACRDLEEWIHDQPITHDEQALLSGLYVYGYSLRDMAERTGQAYETVKKRHQRLLARLKKNHASRA
jgi:hypothetical protein